LAYRSRSASNAALFALLLAVAVAATHAPASAADGVGTAVWSPLTALYDGGLRLDPNAESTSFAAAAQSEEPPAGEAPRRAIGKKALLYSLLIPGMGELSMGEKGRAIGFFVGEGLIWTNFVYWKVAGHLRKDDYVEQAMLNAGVGVDKESDDYWRVVGQFERSSGAGPGSYEEDLRREARDLFPLDPAAQDAFVAAKLPTGDRAWDWSSSELQNSYQNARESSRRAFNRAQYSFAAAILNRVVSVIDVQLLRHKAAKEAQSSRVEPDTRLYADTDADGYGRLVLERRF
jgi:hypothetical protein